VGIEIGDVLRKLNSDIGSNNGLYTHYLSTYRKYGMWGRLFRLRDALERIPSWNTQ